MKILLINSNQLKHPWPVIPFGLCNVAAYLEKEGHDVRFLDLCFSRNSSKDCHVVIEDFAPDVVGISIRNIDNCAGYHTIFMLDQIKSEVIDPCKMAFSGPIVIGGPSVGISGIEILHFFDLEFAIQGDGEEAMAAFVNRFENKLPMDGLGGFIWREGSRIVEDNPPLRVQTLDRLPTVKFDRYIELKRYRRFNSPIQIQTKRGCALACSYCTYNRIEGSTYRFRNPSKVADEIESLISETGINHIEFTDSTFNIPLGHAKRVLSAIISKKLKLRCRTMGLNPSAVDEELVDLMKQVGFQDVDLGVESGSNVTLQTLGKNFDKKDVLRAGKLLRERDIPTSWYLLVGAPGETADTLNETFDTISTAVSPWDLVIIGVGIRIYHGAPLAEQMKLENPKITNDNFLHPVWYEPEKLNLDTIKIFTKQAFLRHSNFLMYDENSQYPAFLLKAIAVLMKFLAPNQPIWRSYILVRKFLRFIGVYFVVKVLFYFKHRKILSALKQ
jgi:radical SAM superfamily enzyme YgiQ (UPF0313 family)